MLPAARNSFSRETFLVRDLESHVLSPFPLHDPSFDDSADRHRRSYSININWSPSDMLWIVKHPKDAWML